MSGSSGPESRFINAVHRHLPSAVYRMKNHNQFNSGIADCWYSGPGGDLWVEYKHLVLPKQDSTVVDLRIGKKPTLSVLQQNWLRDRYHEGRSVGVIIGTPSGGIWLPGLTWDRPISAGDCRARTGSKQTMAQIIHDHCTP